MKEGLKSEIKPMIDKVKNLLKFEEFLEKEIDVLEQKLLYGSRDNNYLNTEIIPRINRLEKIISYIDKNEDMEVDDSDMGIKIQTLRSMKVGSRFKKCEREFNNLKKIFEEIKSEKTNIT